MRTEPALPYSFTNPIRTERVTIRLMTPDDVDAVYSYQSREDVCRYLLHGPRTREDLVERVSKYAEATTLAADGDYWQLGIELTVPERAAQFIGELYFTISNLESSRAEIGWTMHPDFHGHGYATEAANALLDVAFRDIGLHRVYAELDPRNTASIALCTRLGMREEAHFVQDLWFKGEWADTGIYALLRDEWLAR
ncbi:MAG TPA: GNAT family N-acetyltransferase [Galbitalea sp.]|jgi:RimJ/RimL family protein N-acetyltransferase